MNRWKSAFIAYGHLTRLEQMMIERKKGMLKLYFRDVSVVMLISIFRGEHFGGSIFIIKTSQILEFKTTNGLSMQTGHQKVGVSHIGITDQNILARIV